VRIGDGWGWGAIALALWLFLPQPQFLSLVAQGILAIAISLPIYFSIKFGIRRRRPSLVHSSINPRVPPLDRYSLPSGHTMNNLSVAVVLALNLPGIWAPALGVPLSLGLFRVVFGVHFLSDILLGFALGTGCAWVAHSLAPHLLPF
jgi:undecaprenyl-diphosphatase